MKEAKKKQSAGAQSDVGAALERVRSAVRVRRGVSSALVDFADLDGEGLRSLGERAKSIAPDLALVLFNSNEFVYVY